MKDYNQKIRHLNRLVGKVSTFFFFSFSVLETLKRLLLVLGDTSIYAPWNSSFVRPVETISFKEVFKVRWFHATSL